MPVRSRLRVRKGLSDALSPFCVPSSQPQSLRDSPFQGHTGHSHRSGRVPSLLRFSAKILLTRAARRLKPPCLLLHHDCTTKNLQIAGVLPGIKCIFTGKLLSVPSFSGVSRAVSLCFCTWSLAGLSKIHNFESINRSSALWRNTERNIRGIRCL